MGSAHGRTKSGTSGRVAGCAAVVSALVLAAASAQGARAASRGSEPGGDIRLADQPNTSTPDRRFSAGDYRAAEAGYRALITQYNEQPDLLTKLGWSLLMQGGYDDARAAFTKVDKWLGEPNKTLRVEVRNLEGLGHLALEEQRYEDAEGFFRHAAKIDKKNGEYPFDIAQALFYENRLDDCQKACADIKNDSHGSHAQGAMLAARVAAKTGVPDAKAVAAALLYQNSTKDYLHYMFGQMLEDLNDPAGALAQYKIALTIAPQRWLYQRSCDALSKPAQPAPAAPMPTVPPPKAADPPTLPVASLAR